MYFDNAPPAKNPSLFDSVIYAGVVAASIYVSHLVTIIISSLTGRDLRMSYWFRKK